jgi:exosortase/archaeosortase family protein
VPPPYGLDALLRSSLQLLSSRAAGEVLDLCGFNHLLQGNTIRVPGQQFFVEEACSGVHSLFALTVLAAIYVVWTRRPLVHAVLLLLAAVFWAFLLNMSRIAVVVIVRLVLDADISTGWQHELLGIVLFVAALLLLLSTDHALSFFLERSPQPVMHHSRQAGGASDRTRRTLLPDPTYRIFFAVLAGSFGMVGFLQILPYVLHRQTAAPPSAEGRQLAAVIRQSDLPATNGGWSQAKFEKVVRQAGHAYDFGEYSDTWTYRDRDLTVLCSLDYPFAGWHDLRVCYRGQGWQIVETEYEFLDDEWSTCVIELTLKRGANEYGHVSYVVFDRKSQSIPPYSAVFELGRPSWHVIRSTVLKRLIRFGVTDYTSFQFQAFTFSSSPLSDSQLTRTRTLFLQLLRTVRPRVVR